MRNSSVLGIVISRWINPPATEPRWPQTQEAWVACLRRYTLRLLISDVEFASGPAPHLIVFRHGPHAIFADTRSAKARGSFQEWYWDQMKRIGVRFRT
jgi:hypothetical protein